MIDVTSYSHSNRWGGLGWMLFHIALQLHTTPFTPSFMAGSVGTPGPVL